MVLLHFADTAMPQEIQMLFWMMSLFDKNTSRKEDFFFAANSIARCLPRSL